MLLLNQDGSIEGKSSFSFYGWTLTEAPPPITGVNSFGASPSPLIKLHSNEFQPNPAQTITPSQPATGSFSMTGSPEIAGTNWVIFNQASLTTILETPYCCDLMLTLDVAGSGELSITVNGISLAPIPFNNKTLTNQTIQIDALLMAQFSSSDPYNLNANSNKLVIGANNPTDAFVISSITVESSNVNVVAYAQWYQCYATTMPAGTQFSYGVQVNNGVTTTTSKSETFTDSLQVSCNPTSGADFLKLIGLGLSITLNVSSSVTEDTGITLDHSIEQTYNYQLPVLTQESSLQIWQIALVYQVGNHYLTQYLGIGKGVLIINIYPEPPSPTLN